MANDAGQICGRKDSTVLFWIDDTFKKFKSL